MCISMWALCEIQIHTTLIFKHIGMNAYTFNKQYVYVYVSAFCYDDRQQ